MSNIYVQEPDTTGKVVFTTSHGEIEIELWTKETPKACRNFIQLIMEGYYNNTSFHRLIPGFMIQGGDPTGTGKGGESIYGKTFIDEFHSRLKFSHRGIVAMANGNKPNDNASQFFITFDQCSWLNKKHTIFGKVVGDTVYNLLAMEHIDIDSEDKPVNPPKILSAKVLINPFDDIVLRNITVNKEKIEKANKINKIEIQALQPKKATKKDTNINLLSFQEDEDIEEPEKKIEKKESKMKSSHDVLNDPFLKKEAIVNLAELEQQKQKKKEEELKRDEFRSKISDLDQNKLTSSSDTKELLKTFIQKKRLIGAQGDQFLKIISENSENKELLKGMKKRRNKKTGKIELYWESDSDKEKNSDDSDYSSTDSEEFINDEEKKIRDRQKEEYENLKIEFLTFKKNKLGTQNPDEIKKEGEEKKLLSAVELQRMKYLQNKRIKLRENEILDKLKQFKEKLSSENVKTNSEHWMNNKLKFHIDSASAYSQMNIKDKMEEVKDRDDGLIVIDPKKNKNREEDKLKDENAHFSKFLTVENIIKMTDSDKF